MKSPSSTPSPASSAASANLGPTRGNPFSIDYILSSNEAAAAAAVAAASQKQQAEQMHQALQLDLMNQQRAQLMAAAAAVAASQQVAAGNVTHQQQQHQHQVNHHLNQINETQAQQFPAQLQRLIHNSTMPPQLKPNQQPPLTQQQQQQQQAHPNFLYFMACMLLQQQQQQQQQHQVAARQQAREEQLANISRQQPSAQTIGLTPSPIDSLAVFARLAGLPGQLPAPLSSVARRNEQSAATNNHIIGKQPPAANGNRLSHSSQSLRHQPYQSHSPESQAVGRQMMGNHSQVPFGAHLVAQQQQQQQQQRHLSRQSQQMMAVGSATDGKQVAADRYAQRLPDQRHAEQSNKPSNQQQTGLTNATNTGNQQQQQQPAERLDNLKPAHSYIGLIGMCILSSPEKRMVLNDIYHFILDNYPYYRNRGSGWRNSVRHNLSLNECFQKAGRAANGKGHYWTIHPANMEDFMLGDFRRRRAQRKVRRWNNMDVPSDESEDESMEDATKPPLPDHFRRSLEMHRQLELSYQKSVESFSSSLQQAIGASLPGAAPTNPHAPLAEQSQQQQQHQQQQQQRLLTSGSCSSPSSLLSMFCKHDPDLANGRGAI